MASKIILAALLAAAVPAIAKTDLSGCTSYDSILFQGNSPYVSKIYYVPDTGEVCEFLDCGGGRAPPKTTVPGCGSYEGTETYSPRFINPKTLGEEVASETGAAESETEEATATITEAPSSTGKAGSETSEVSEEDETTAEDEETTTAEEASTAEDTTAEETTAVEQTTTTAKDASKTITTVTTQGTPAAGSGASTLGSESESDAAATPAASTVSTGGAVMPTAGAFLGSCLMAGAMYAGLL